MQPETPTTQPPAAPAPAQAPAPSLAPEATPPAAGPAPAPAAEPAKKKSPLKIIAIIAAVFVGLLVIGGIVALNATSKTVKTANSFVGSVVTKDFDSAYDYFSPELKQVQSLEQFKSALQSAPFDANCTLKITGREASAETGSGASKKITGNIKCGNTLYPTELVFINSNGSEKLLSYNVKPASN